MREKTNVYILNTIYIINAAPVIMLSPEQAESDKLHIRWLKFSFI